MSLAATIYTSMKKDQNYTLQEIYNLVPHEKNTTVRGRVYDHLNKMFERVDKGIYRIKSNGAEGLVICGDSRGLDKIKNESVECIYADHPWSDSQLKGVSRNFIKGYEESLFRYEQSDFDAKYRVLKHGGFLVENLPEENERNFQYLYEIKMMAIKAGFKYYALVPWKKGNFIACTGRKKKNTEYLMIFSKGEARKLRKDAQRGGLMSGTTEMLPTEFNHQSTSPKLRKHSAEKPVELFVEMLKFVMLEGETIVDQFAGSFNLMEAALSQGRNCISYEISEEYVFKYVNDKENK